MSRCLEEIYSNYTITHPSNQRAGHTFDLFQDQYWPPNKTRQTEFKNTEEQCFSKSEMKKFLTRIWQIKFTVSRMDITPQRKDNLRLA